MYFSGFEHFLSIPEADLLGGDDVSSDNPSTESLLSMPVTVKQYYHSSVENTILLVRNVYARRILIFWKVNNSQPVLLVITERMVS